jgi:pyruvate/2-oxoglutarate/acetoin dehydrogenase E1 component
MRARRSWTGTETSRSAALRSGRRGSDVTIAAALAMVEAATAAAERLAGDGVEADVIDLRTLRPLDRDMIADSVGRTGRLVSWRKVRRRAVTRRRSSRWPWSRRDRCPRGV